MEIKAVACDVDSTLTDDLGMVNLYAVETIRYLEALGLPVIVVTSRDYDTAGSLSTLMGACGVVVAEDGTVLGDYRSGQPPVIVGDRAVIRQGLDVLHGALGNQVQAWIWPSRICSAVLQLGDGIADQNPFADRRHPCVDRGNAILAEHGVPARLVDFGIVCVLNDISVNKGTGLQEAAKMLGIQSENVVAIGDNFNDLDMFAVAGYGIAVGNAPQAVKDQVDYACTACFGEGFCEGVKHALARFCSKRALLWTDPT